MAIELRGAAVLLGVYDMGAAVRFYRDLLGFEVVNTSPRLENEWFHWALLRLAEAELMLNTNYESDDGRPAVEDKARVAGHGDVTIYLECPDVDAAYEELRGRGLAVEKPTVARYGMKQMYLRDPDGYGVCFQWRADGAE